MPRPQKPPSPFRYFHSSPEVIRMVVMLYVRYPLSLRNVEDLLSSAGLTCVTKRSGCDGIVSVRCLQ